MKENENKLLKSDFIKNVSVKINLRIHIINYII